MTFDPNYDATHYDEYMSRLRREPTQLWMVTTPMYTVDYTREHWADLQSLMRAPITH